MIVDKVAPEGIPSRLLIFDLLAGLRGASSHLRSFLGGFILERIFLVFAPRVHTLF